MRWTHQCHLLRICASRCSANQRARVRGRQAVGADSEAMRLHLSEILPLAPMRLSGVGSFCDSADSSARIIRVVSGRSKAGRRGKNEFCIPEIRCYPPLGNRRLGKHPSFHFAKQQSAAPTFPGSIWGPKLPSRVFVNHSIEFRHRAPYATAVTVVDV
jgi:hypothetical protein